MKAATVKIRQYFRPVLGLRPLRVKLGVGSFLTFDFGPRSRSYGHLCARWRLWIYLSNWSLFHGDHELVNSDSDRDRITIVAHRIEEESSLTEVDFDPRGRKTTFLFDNFRLVVSPADYLEDANERDDYWIFFMPDNEVLALGPSGIQVEQGDAHRSSHDQPNQEVKILAEGRRQIKLED